MGVGDWAEPLVENNPDLDGIIKINALGITSKIVAFLQITSVPSLRAYFVLISKEIQFLRKQKYTHGIGVLGSRQGSWLPPRPNSPSVWCPWIRGGDKTCEKCVDFVENCKVAESALAFLPLLGGQEKVRFETNFCPSIPNLRKLIKIGVKVVKIQSIIIIAQGRVSEKSWGNERFTKLVEILYNRTNHQSGSLAHWKIETALILI